MVKIVWNASKGTFFDIDDHISHVKSQRLDIQLLIKGCMNDDQSEEEKPVGILMEYVELC